MTDVVVVGSYNHDHVWRTPQFPVPGETRLGEFTSGPGGKGFNQAVAAARQGVRAAFIAALGRDAIGDHALALATQEGIDPRIERHDATASGTAAILLDASGHPLLDAEAEALLARASPVPAPPDGTGRSFQVPIVFALR